MIFAAGGNQSIGVIKYGRLLIGSSGTIISRDIYSDAGGVISNWFEVRSIYIVDENRISVVGYDNRNI